jgi:hypothetical protein
MREEAAQDELRDYNSEIQHDQADHDHLALVALQVPPQPPLPLWRVRRHTVAVGMAMRRMAFLGGLVLPMADAWLVHASAVRQVVLRCIGMVVVLLLLLLPLLLLRVEDLRCRPVPFCWPRLGVNSDGAAAAVGLLWLPCRCL